MRLAPLLPGRCYRGRLLRERVAYFLRALGVGQDTTGTQIRVPDIGSTKLHREMINQDTRLADDSRTSPGNSALLPWRYYTAPESDFRSVWRHTSGRSVE